MEKATFEITGMSCGHCVKAVDQALRSADGVEVEQVVVGSATVRFDPSKTSSADLAERIADEGYQVVATR